MCSHFLLSLFKHKKETFSDVLPLTKKHFFRFISVMAFAYTQRFFYLINHNEQSNFCYIPELTHTRYFSFSRTLYSAVKPHVYHRFNLYVSVQQLYIELGEFFLQAHTHCIDPVYPYPNIQYLCLHFTASSIGLHERATKKKRITSCIDLRIA